MRASASHQHDLGSNPSIDAVCSLSLLSILSFALKGFSLDALVFPSPHKNKTNFKSITNQVDYMDVLPQQKVESPHQGCALAKPSGPWCRTFVPRWLQNLSFFMEIIMLGTLDFKGSEHWAPFSFSQSTALPHFLLVHWTTPTWRVKGQCFWKENCHCYVLFASKTISQP